MNQDLLVEPILMKSKEKYSPAPQELLIRQISNYLNNSKIDYDKTN